jgi:hypothetical protein
VCKGIEGWAGDFVIVHGIGDGIHPAVDHSGESVFQQRFEVRQSVSPPGRDHAGKFKSIESTERRERRNECIEELGTDTVEFAVLR